AVIPAKMTHLSLVHGNCDLSPFGYMTYGIILGAVLGEYDKAHQMGRMALELNERFRGTGLVSKLCLVFGAFINFFTNPLRPNLAYLERGIAAGLETGDFAYASYCCNNLVLHRIGLGDELSSVREDCDKFLTLMARTQEKPMVSMLTLSRQVTANL